ncbi:MAG: hypothetical protein ACXWMB_05025, partial [Candidatus Limnocylindria bacterium]
MHSLSPLRHRVMVTAMAVTLLGCTAQSTPTPSRSNAASPAATPSPSASPAPSVAPLQGIRLEKVVSGLTSPIGVTSAGDGTGRLFINEQAGRIRVVEP